MANVNVGFGLKPINVAGSTPATQGTNSYFIDSSASAIYQGSPVIATNGGEIAVSSSASGDTLKFVGVFAGCEYVAVLLSKMLSTQTFKLSCYNLQPLSICHLLRPCIHK